MKLLGRAAALTGLLVAAWLFWRSEPGVVFALLRAAGLGLLGVALLHVLPMLVSSRIWQLLILDPCRPRLPGMLQLVWIRESINGLLPVARLGGEVVSFRMLRRQGVAVASSVASLMVDMQIFVLCQLLFTLAGIGYLLGLTNSGALHLAGRLAWSLAAFGPLVFLFAAMQYVNPFQRLGRFANGLAGGRWGAVEEHAAGIDQGILAIWRKRGTIALCLLVWQPIQCLAVSFEIWVALRILGHPIGLASAMTFEVLIQAVSSAAFFIPGGLGVQESAFVVIGGVLGLSPPTCLALAATRRLRDVAVFGAGLVAWQYLERNESSESARAEVLLEECR